MMMFIKILKNIKYKFAQKESNGYKIEGFVDEVTESDAMQNFGLFSKPIAGTRGFKYATKNGKNPVVIATKNYDVEAQLDAMIEDGESVLYSVDGDGTIKSTIILKKDGTLQLNGSTESIVLGNVLQVALSTMIAELNSHTHTGNMGSPTSPPLSPISEIGNEILSQKNFGE